MLYQLNKQELTQSSRVLLKSPHELGIKEKHIEDFLSSRLGEIVSEEQLMLIGRESSFQEEADLLALDKDGTLYIFELKRWEAHQENILQVMRYGQIFGQYSYSQLNDFTIRKLKPNHSYDLVESHQIHFELDEPLEKSNFNQKQVFVLITNGLDRETISAVNYWSKNGIEIECVPYLIYEIEGNPYIEFSSYNLDDLPPVEQNEGFFIVNTCERYATDDWKPWKVMFDNNKAAAYGNARFGINRISIGDNVYLYHSGTGVIAKGKAMHEVKECGDEHFIALNFEWKLEKYEWERAPKAWQINQELNTGHKFMQTVFAIKEEMAMAIDKIYKENL